ncbi:MAG: hypothetical protein JWQ75_2042 [Pseudarthrobacter sp.]|nr:hypothetical protein [Pseudarthrobacter sp.]
MSTLGYLAASVPPRLAMSGSVVAIPILAVQELDNVGIGGALVATALGPSVIAAPIVGAALDRSRRPEVLIAASGFVTAAAYGTASFLGQVPLPVIFAFLAVAGALAPFYMGGLSSFVADEIPDQRRAFAYDALSYNISAVAGPALVAVMAVFLPGGAALWVLSAASLIGALSAATTQLKARGATALSVWSTVRSGLHRILSYRPLAVVTGASTLSQLGQGGLAVAAVALSIERSGSPGQGALLVTAFAVGSLLGALCETIRPTRARPHTVMMLGFLATGLLTIGAAFDFGTAWTVVTIGLSGVFTASSTAALMFLRNHLSPPHLRSQIFTVGAGFRASASAAGAALAASATGMGGGIAVAGIGLIWVASAALMAGYPAPGRDVAA